MIFLRVNTTVSQRALSDAVLVNMGDRYGHYTGAVTVCSVYSILLEGSILKRGQL